jgi:hypothetical protein
MNAITTVTMISFRGRAIPTVKDAAGVVCVALRPIVEAMGLDWSGQLQRIKRCPIMGPSVGIITTEAVHGARDSVTLPLEMLNGFLFGIDSGKVKAELRELVLAYQRECYRVLADYWMGGGQANAVLSPRQRERLWQEHRNVRQALRIARDPQERRFEHARLIELCADLGLEPPEPLVDFAPEDDLIAQFWMTVDAAMAAGLLENHHRRPALLAFRGGELAMAFKTLKAGIRLDPKLKAALATGPRPLIATKPINSRITRRAVHCLVFQAMPLPARAAVAGYFH